MKAWLSRWMPRILPICLLVIAVVGCDEDDDYWSSNETIDVIYAIGDVVLAIIRMFVWP